MSNKAKERKSHPSVLSKEKATIEPVNFKSRQGCMYRQTYQNYLRYVQEQHYLSMIAYLYYTYFSKKWKIPSFCHVQSIIN